MMYWHVILLFCMVFDYSKCTTEDLKPLCSHPSEQRVATLDSFPEPEYLFQWYVLPSQPVLFKSVLGKVQYPAYIRWSDQYLREKYGHLLAETEEPKLGYRNPDNVKTRLLRHVLDEYKTTDIYMIQKVNKEMEDEVLVPPSLRCGGFQEIIHNAYVWLSSGGTRGVLHYDDMDNINCLLDGSKDLKLISWKHRDLVEADGFNMAAGFSTANVTHLDLDAFPRLRDIPWVEVRMEQGDCLFIPNKWYHQVNSYGDRNLAINIWFEALPWFNHSDCDSSHARSDVISDYPRATPSLKSRLALLNHFRHLTELTRNHLHLLLTEDGNQDQVDEMFNYLDGNSDEIVSWDELMTFDLEQFREMFE